MRPLCADARRPGRSLRLGLPVLLIGGALAAALVPACSGDDEASNIANFAGPSAIVLAGPGRNRLFIANRHEDTLHVATIGETLDSFELLRAPAVHFALRIPAGPLPSELAATGDGRYVVVLNGVGETLRLIDASGLVPVLSEGSPLAVPAGPPGSAPANLVAAATGNDVPPELACSSPCQGRFYVALAGRGSIAVFEVREVEGSSPTLVAAGEITVGGTPVAVAVHPHGRFVFASDAATSQVVRVDMSTGAVVDRLDVGATPGALVVSRDGDALVVARPRLWDVVVFGGAGATPALVDADPPYVPQLVCIEACDVPGTCAGQHAADAAICGTGGGLAASPGVEAYQAVYLGVVPSRMAALQAGAQPGQEGLTVACSTATQSYNRSYSQFVAVASLSGHISFIGLKQTSDGSTTPELDPELVTTSFCEQSTVAETTEGSTLTVPPITDYLGACPPVPGRARFACTGKEVELEGGTKVKKGVVAFPARSGGTQWSFDWEGILLSRDKGGRIEPYAGTAEEASFAFADIIQDLGTASIEPGDILEIRTAPENTDDSACDAVAPKPAEEGKSLRRCALEWRIVRLDTSVTPARLVLAARSDGSLVEACYKTPGVIAYNIRARDQYVLRRSGRFQGRISPGTTIGPGGDRGWDFEALFEFNPTLPTLPTEACERYDDEGISKVGDTPDNPTLKMKKPLVSRDHPFGFTIEERYSPVRAGYDYSMSGSPLAGALPGDMQAVVLPGGRTVLFVTYEASNPPESSNPLFGLDPFVVATFNEDENYLVIR